jgi:hypothetical protein
MRLRFDDDRDVFVHEMTLEDWRKFMSEFLSNNSNASKAWDIMGCVRGPDAGLGEFSERPDMNPKEHQKAYSGRVARKMNTVAVLRYAMFFGTMGGAARSRKSDHVTVPPAGEHDHFDKHVVRAANALKLKVVYKEK